MDEPSFLSRSYLPNPASRLVALRELNPHLVAGNQPDEVGAETISDVGDDPDPVLQLNSVHAVWERLENPTVDERGGPGHERRLYRNAVLTLYLERRHSNSPDSSHRDSLRHYAIRAGKYGRTTLGNRHCVLEVRRKRPVRCADRPPVRFDVHIRRTLVDHRLDRESHPGLQLRSSARHTEVRELRVLVHRAPDSMPDELPDD